MRSRRLVISLIAALVLVLGAYAATPYARALSLIVRAANMGGSVEAFANDRARAITVDPEQTIPTRHGALRARLYRPEGPFTRTVLLVPGIHAMGIDEPRLMALAQDLAGSGVAVMTIALPGLQQYEITPRSTDQIEDAVAWTAQRHELAPDGRIGLVGISFAGGMSIVAAGRPPIRERVAFVLSFGGHGDLPRVTRYLCTGEAPAIAGIEVHPPHDYGVAVVLYGMAPRVVPPEQVQGLREGIRTFLWASQLTLVDHKQADETFARARDIAKTLPAPSSTYLTHVNDRNVRALGPVLVPHIAALSSGADISPERTPSPPSAPVFLLHGADDTVIPSVESVLLGERLERQGVRVRVLLSRLITHAEVDQSAAASETWKLVSFWADVLQR
jgi:alpha-beta hydrolase superfamily lysophospholipase